MFQPKSRRPRAVAALILAAVLSAVAVPASADHLSDLQEQLDAAKAEQAAGQDEAARLQAELEDTDDELALAYQNLEATRQAIPVAQLELDQANADSEAAQRSAQAASDRLATAQREADRLRETIDEQATEVDEARRGVAAMAREAARGTNIPTALQVFLGAQTLSDLVDELSMSDTALRTQGNAVEVLRTAQALAESNQVRLSAAEASIEELSTLAQQKADEAAAAAQTAQDKRDALATLEAQQEQYAAEVEQRKADAQAAFDKNQQELDATADDVRRLTGLTDAERQRIADEEAARLKAAQQQAASTGSASAGTAIVAPQQGGSGFLTAPLPSLSVTSSFGLRFHPIFKTWILHAGTDFGAACGTPIYAAAAGTVVHTKYNGGHGNQVMISNGTYQGASIFTTYNHMSAFAVSPGQSVAQGQVVGYVGSTGNSTGCHLHFEVLKNGSYTDPMGWLS